MENINKQKELKKELNLLYQVAQNVHSLEIDDLLRKIVKIAIKVTKGDSCLIYILDKKKQELVLRASKNPHRKLLRQIKMKIGEGITGWVAKEKKPVAISKGASKDNRFKFFHNLPEDLYEAFLSVPIINRHGVWGVINIQHKKEHIYSATEIKFLSAIGKLVGGAVENALLIEEAYLLREALDLRKLIEKAKGIIMKQRNIDEEQAFKLLRKESMNSRKSLKEISEAIILANNVLDKQN